MFKLLIEDIENTSSRAVTQISRQDQKMTVGGCFEPPPSEPPGLPLPPSIPKIPKEPVVF